LLKSLIDGGYVGKDEGNQMTKETDKEIC